MTWKPVKYGQCEFLWKMKAYWNNTRPVLACFHGLRQTEMGRVRRRHEEACGPIICHPRTLTDVSSSGNRQTATEQGKVSWWRLSKCTKMIVNFLFSLRLFLTYFLSSSPLPVYSRGVTTVIRSLGRDGEQRRKHWENQHSPITNNNPPPPRFLLTLSDVCISFVFFNWQSLIKPSP